MLCMQVYQQLKTSVVATCGAMAPDNRIAFLKLSIFSGYFTEKSAQAVLRLKSARDAVLAFKQFDQRGLLQRGHGAIVTYKLVPMVKDVTRCARVHAHVCGVHATVLYRCPVASWVSVPYKLVPMVGWYPWT